MNHTIHHPSPLDAPQHRRRPRRSWAIAVPVVAAGITLAAAPASADTGADDAAVDCGTVVTHDIQLTHDLADCDGAGLIIGASGVTIDLGGHTIDGTGNGAGIDNGAGFDDVTVRNGTIRQFVFGIHLFETRGAQITGVVVEGNLDGLKIERSNRVTIDHTAALDNAVTGMEVTFSDRVTVRDSTASGSLLGGFVDRYSGTTTVERSTFTGNVGPGITVDGTASATIVRTVVSGNDSDGIVVVAVDAGSVTRNTVTLNSGTGIVVDGSAVRVARNELSGNGGGACAGVTCS